MPTDTLQERVARALAEYDTDIRDLPYMEAADIFIRRAGIASAPLAPTPAAPAGSANAVADLAREAIRFADWSAGEGIMPAAVLAERDATIAALRAEVERLTGGIAEMVERMRRVKAEQAEWLAKCLIAVEAHEAEIARLLAGITAAVEGRYERVPDRTGVVLTCDHGAGASCAACLRAHLLALLDPVPAGQNDASDHLRGNLPAALDDRDRDDHGRRSRGV